MLVVPSGISLRILNTVELFVLAGLNIICRIFEPWQSGVTIRSTRNVAPVFFTLILLFLAIGRCFRRAAFDLRLELHLSTERMRKSGLPPLRLSRGQAREVGRQGRRPAR